MTFGSLLLQHTKNLSHGTLWRKYVLFSVTHNTLLYNRWRLVLAQMWAIIRPLHKNTKIYRNSGIT
jgi:hypothetical protein